MKSIKLIYHLLREYYLEQLFNDLKIEISDQEPLVSFLGVGAQKSGTTALDNYLRQHIELSLPDRKEIHYFDNEYNFRFHRVNYTRYHSFFSENNSYKIAGEVTPSYMYWDGAVRRIWEYNSRIKLVILLRNPIQRAYSHWNMNRVKGSETLSFMEAVNKEKERMKASLPFQNKKYAYLDRGLYSHQLRRIFRYFPIDQVLILRSSALSRDPASIMKLVFSFLGVDPITVQVENPAFQGNYSTQMSYEIRDFLTKYYYNDIKELENILGWDCSDWL